MGTPGEKGGTVPNFSRFPALPYRMALHSRGTQGRAGFSWGWVGVTEEEEKEGEERRGKKEGREDAGLGLGARPPACWGTSPIAPAAARPSCGGSSPHRLTRLPALPFLSHTAGPALCPELSLSTSSDRSPLRVSHSPPSFRPFAPVSCLCSSVFHSLSSSSSYLFSAPSFSLFSPLPFSFPASFKLSFPHFFSSSYFFTVSISP